MNTRAGGRNGSLEQQYADVFINLPQRMEQIANAIQQSNSQMIQLVQNISNDMIQTIQTQSELTRQCIRECFEEQKVNNEDKKELLDTLSKETKQCIETCTEKITSSITTILVNSTKNQATSEEILKEKENVSEFWNETLNKRKTQYWKYYRNKKLSEIYTDGLNKEIPEMPRKYQPICIENESTEEFEIRKEGALVRFKNDIKLIQARSQRHEKDFQKTDEELLKFLNENYNNDTAHALYLQWQKECRDEEKKSASLYSKNEEFHKENLTNEPKPSKEKKQQQQERKEKVESNESTENTENTEDSKNSNYNRRGGRYNSYQGNHRRNNNYSRQRRGNYRNQPFLGQRREYPRRR